MVFGDWGGTGLYFVPVLSFCGLWLGGSLAGWLLAFQTIRHAEVWAQASWNESGGGRGCQPCSVAHLPGCPCPLCKVTPSPHLFPSLKLPEALSHP